MRTVCILLIFTFPILLSSQVVESHLTQYFQIDWEPGSVNDHYFMMKVNNDPLSMYGDTMYKYQTFDKKNRLRYEGFVYKPDSVDYAYLNKIYDRKGRLRGFWVEHYHRYISKLEDEYKQYYDVLEPFLQDTFIQYSDDFQFRVGFKKNGNPDHIVAIDPDCYCTLTRLTTLFSDAFLLMEDEIDGKTAGRKFWYYKSGQIKRKEYIKDGHKFGRHEGFLKDGRLWYYINYHKGKRHGECAWFYKNGNLKQTGFYKNGTKHKTWTFYNLDGTIKEVRIYDEDKLIY